MIPLQPSFRLKASVALCAFVSVVLVARADMTRTQSISLHAGWNAVFLEVNPTNAKVANCFQGTPVTIVAAYTKADKSVQYVQNPSATNITQQNGWDVWYAPSRPDAFLSRLFALNGNKPYLLYATSDFTWTVTGNALLTSVKWKPSSFTLSGFGVDEVSPPTFDQFFAASPQHQPYQIYQLVNDVWTRVDSAQTAQMQSGQAYWIYCNGTSDYQGPLAAKVPSRQNFVINGVNPAGISLVNNSKNPLSVQVKNVSGGAQLPLAFVLRAVTDTNVVTATYDLPDTYNLSAFDAGEARGVWLNLRSERMSAATQTGLLEITTDLGTKNWLPITANRSDSP